MTRKGLPHSEIPGSKPVCGSPRLIAACHVLHRLCAPRHPPSTLSSLTIKYLRRVLICQFCLPDSFVKDPDLFGSRRRTRASVFLIRNGGADRVRTDDLRLAKPPLSQLSYGPVNIGPAPRRSSRFGERRRVVGLGRFELPTSRLSGVRSNQLSYRPR
jgi:hypothetical protein